MPRGVYDAMKGYADTWATPWRARLGRALVDARRPGGRGTGRADERTQGKRLDPSERHHLPGRDRLLPGLLGQTQQGRLQRHEFPVGDVLLGGAAAARRAGTHGEDRRHQCPDRKSSGCHRRPDACRADLARAVPERVYQRRRRHYRESAQGRCLRRARHLSLTWHHAARCAEAQYRFRLRRRFEMAMRGARRRLPLRAPRLGEKTPAAILPDGTPTSNRSASKPAPFTTPIRPTVS